MHKKPIHFILLLIILMVAGCKSFPYPSKNEIDKACLYAVLSANSYYADENTPFHLPHNISEIKNNKFDFYRDFTCKGKYINSGVFSLEGDLQAKIFEVRDKGSLESVIIAYRGTEISNPSNAFFDIICGTVNKTQRLAAIEFYCHISQFYHNIDIYLTGHSLGGALAMEVSLQQPVDAYVFNPSYRIDYKNTTNNGSIYVFEEKGDYVPWLFFKRPVVAIVKQINSQNCCIFAANNNHSIINMAQYLIKESSQKELIELNLSSMPTKDSDD